MAGPWQVFDVTENRCRALHSDKQQAEAKAKELNDQIARDANGLKRFIVMELND